MEENGNQIELFHIPESETDIPVILKDESVWLTQGQMAELFQTSVTVIGTHIRNILQEGELAENSVGKDFLITVTDRKNYRTKHYSLDMITAVGYRISSKTVTRFRIWAEERLNSL